MKRNRAFSNPSSPQVKTVRFDESLVYEDAISSSTEKLSRTEFDSSDSPKRKHRKHKHHGNGKEKSPKKKLSSPSKAFSSPLKNFEENKENVSDKSFSPQAKLYLVTDEKVQPMTFDEVVKFVSIIRQKDLSTPKTDTSPEYEEHMQKKRILDLVEDIMKEMELFQRIILNRSPGSLSRLLSMKEVEKVNTLVACLGVNTPKLHIVLSKEDTVAAYIHQIGKRLLQIKVELVNNTNVLRSIRLTQLVQDMASFLISGKPIDMKLYEDLWPEEEPSTDLQQVLKQGILKEVRPGFQSSKKRGFILHPTLLKIYKDEKFEDLKEELDVSNISSLYTNAFNKTQIALPNNGVSLPNDHNAMVLNQNTLHNLDNTFYIVTSKKKYKLSATGAIEMSRWLVALDKSIMNCGFISKLDPNEKIQLEYINNNN